MDTSGCLSHHCEECQVAAGTRDVSAPITVFTAQGVGAKLLHPALRSPGAGHGVKVGLPNTAIPSATPAFPTSSCITVCSVLPGHPAALLVIPKYLL